MIRANIVIPTRNRSSSKSLIESVQPDNLSMKGLAVKGKPSDHAASFQLEFDGKIETFISTLDDLLLCLHAAMETLEKISN